MRRASNTALLLAAQRRRVRVGGAVFRGGPSVRQEALLRDGLLEDDRFLAAQTVRTENRVDRQHLANFPFSHRSDTPQLDHGVGLEAIATIAEVEADHAQSRRALAGGSTDVQPLLSGRKGQPLLAPFGERLIPSVKRRYAARQGEYDYWQAKALHSPTHAQETPRLLESQRVEQALLDVLMSPMALEPLRAEVKRLTAHAVQRQLLLRPSTAESAVALLSVTSPRDRREAAKAAAALLSSGAGAALSLRANNGLQSVIPNPNFDTIVALYFHQRATSAAPTPAMVERLMFVVYQGAVALLGPSNGLVGLGAGDARALTQARRGAGGLLALARRLMIDADRYVFLPSRHTYAMYFGVCALFGDMPAAVRRYVDAIDTMAVLPSPAMLETLLRGLTSEGLVDEAVAVIGRVSEIEMTTTLLNAVLEALLLSKEAAACFSAFDALGCGSRAGAVRPDAQTFSLMLLACEQAGQWDRAPGLMSTMQALRVKGDADCLNLMLKGLILNDLTAYAEGLFATMRERAVPVWPVLADAMREAHSGLGKEALRSEHFGGAAALEALRATGAAALHSRILGLEGAPPGDEAAATAVGDSATNLEGDRGDSGAPELSVEGPTADFHWASNEGAGVEVKGSVSPSPAKPEGGAHEDGHRRFVTPRSKEHLVALFQRQQAHRIDPAALRQFLGARGVSLTPEQASSPRALQRKAHKLLFGTRLVTPQAGALRPPAGTSDVRAHAKRVTQRMT